MVKLCEIKIEEAQKQITYRLLAARLEHRLLLKSDIGCRHKASIGLMLDLVPDLHGRHVCMLQVGKDSLNLEEPNEH